MVRTSYLHIPAVPFKPIPPVDFCHILSVHVGQTMDVSCGCVYRFFVNKKYFSINVEFYVNRNYSWNSAESKVREIFSLFGLDEPVAGKIALS